jgi:O-antigen/teichoic acid export membrane protein
MKRRMTMQDALKMPRWMRAWIYISAAGCFTTGAVWLALHYFTRHEGPFGPEPHPLEHPVLVAHGCIAALMIWCFGLIFVMHIKRGWYRKLNRITGASVSAMALILLLTGLGLYYLGDETVRANAGLAHWLVGLVAGLSLPAHIYWGRYLSAGRLIQEVRP